MSEEIKKTKISSLTKATSFQTGDEVLFRRGTKAYRIDWLLLKGEKGDKFNFADFTASDIRLLQQPAIDAADKANTATTNTNTATQNTNAARDAANTAATGANAAKDAANTAAGKANASAANADTATGKANTATQNANAARDAANMAATGANAAKDAANTAAGKANTSAANADTATGKANTAAKRAEDAVGAIENITGPVQADWNETNTASVQHIRNKPKLDDLSVDWKAKNLILGGSQKFDKQNVKIYKNIAEYAGASLTGIIAIKLPVISGDIRFRSRISLTEYNSDYATCDFDLKASIAPASGGWNYSSVNIIGHNVADNKILAKGIRLGNIRDKYCILIGNVNTSWSQPRVVVSEFLQLYGFSVDFTSGWTFDLITDESGITNIVTPTLVSRTIAPSEFSASATANTFVQRTTTSQVKVAAAVNNDEAVNLQQLNDRFNGSYDIVTSLPAIGVEGKMYLVTTSTANVYNLKTWKQVAGVYKYIDLGSTTVDLSNYAKLAGDLGQNFNAKNIVLAGAQKFDRQSLKVYNHACHYITNTSTTTGTVLMKMPVGWNNIMMNMRILIYDYTTSQHAEYYLRGYNYGGSATEGKSWIGTSLHITGVYQSNKLVRLGYVDDKCCLLFGTTTTAWNYVKIDIETLHASWTGMGADLSTGWESLVVTDESNITGIVAPVISSRTVSPSELAALAPRSITKTATLAVANWVNDTANSGYYKYTVSDVGITADVMKVEYSPGTLADREKGQMVGIQDYAETATGSLVIFAESKPTEAININYLISY